MSHKKMMPLTQQLHHFSSLTILTPYQLFGSGYGDIKWPLTHFFAVFLTMLWYCGDDSELIRR